MGTYTTTTSLEIAMIGTTFDTLTTNFSSQCIDWAESEVNKYISKRYNITQFLSSAGSVPPVIRTITEWLAIGYMYEENSRGGVEAEGRGQKRVVRAIKDLELIANGDLDLTDTSGSSIVGLSNSAFSVYSNTDGYSSTFDEDDSLDWKVDTNKIDAIRDERDD